MATAAALAAVSAAAAAVAAATDAPTLSTLQQLQQADLTQCNQDDLLMLSALGRLFLAELAQLGTTHGVNIPDPAWLQPRLTAIDAALQGAPQTTGIHLFALDDLQHTDLATASLDALLMVSGLARAFSNALLAQPDIRQPDWFPARQAALDAAIQAKVSS